MTQQTSKISIITPSYNDAKSIIETLNSVKEQTYTNWEMIVVDDGSTDNTREVIDKYIKDNSFEDKIKYIYQPNADQLNAILNGLNYITGDFICLLHSDDLLPSVDFLENCLEEFKLHPDIDCVYGDLTIINEKSEITNCWRALRYNKNSKMPANLILNNGCNIYGDFGMRTKECFISTVKENYLTWNMPFWIDMGNNAKILNLHKASFPILKYRIHSDNYAKNEIGKFCALNGELRTLTRLMAIFDIKFIGIQRCIFQALRLPKVRRLGLSGYFTPICAKKPSSTKKVYRELYKAINATYKNKEEIDNNIYLTSLLNFYKHLSDKDFNRSVIFEIKDKEEKIFYGKDVRLFAKALFSNTLSPVYSKFLDQMKEGFTELKVKKEDKETAENMCKFLNIYPYIRITVI